MKSKRLIKILITVLVVMIGVGCGIAAASGKGFKKTHAKTPALEEAKLLIEHNATNEDTGFQGFADGEPWNELSIEGDRDHRHRGHAHGTDDILTVFTEGNLFNFGLTELFFETSEPANAEIPIERVLARIPKGKYAFEADIVGANESQQKAGFTHRIPAGPHLLTPADGSVNVNPNNLAITWDGVTKDIHGTALNIVGYEVIVEKDAAPRFPQGFAKPLFDVYMPASATSVTVPATFLEDDACYKYEVLAIEKSGNQTLSLAAFATGSRCEPSESAEDNTPKLSAAKLLIEHNATDEDTGFQGFADGDPWNELTIKGPDGDQLTVLPEGKFHNFGLTELFFETSEPKNAEVPIEDVLARLPEGTYTFTGDMVDGEKSTMTATFSHKIPAGPVLQTPIDGSTDVDKNNVVVAWDPVTKDINGSDIQIVGYQVIVEKDEEPQYPQGFAKALFSIYLPATATNVAIPVEFMESDAPYKYEVLAIEENGNQTLSSAEFTTR
jgi:hypothetical protein